MSKQYEKIGEIMNEHDYLNDVPHRRGMVSIEDAQRACRIARVRGEIKGAADCGCLANYMVLNRKLKSLLNSINKRQQNP